MADSLHSVSEGGWGWLVVIGAFTGQLIYAASVPLVGVYLVYWQEYFLVGAGAVSIIATELNVGVLFMSVAGALCGQYGCRRVMFAGGFLAFSATLIASFATKLWHLYIYAVVAGIGHGVAMMPTIVILRFYFKRRLGLANGISVAGMSAGILIFAPVINWLCASYGWNGALMVHAAMIANYLVCASLFRPSKLEKQMLRDHRRNAGPRVPVPESEDISNFNKKENKTSLTDRICSWVWHLVHHTFAIPSLLKNRLFVVCTITAFFILWGNVPIFMFLTPKLVYDLQISKSDASLVMTAYGVSGLLARTFHGLLLDYKLITVCNLYLLSVIVSGITPILSPLVSSLVGQFILTIIFGLSTGVLVAVLMLLCRELVPISKAAIAIGHVTTFGGSGILIGSHLTGKLYDVSGSYNVPFFIGGAMLWGSAIVLGLVTKCTSWKPPHLIEDMPSADKEIAMDGVNMTNSSGDVSDQPIGAGYQPIPTNSDAQA